VEFERRHHRCKEFCDGLMCEVCEKSEVLRADEGVYEGLIVWFWHSSALQPTCHKMKWKGMAFHSLPLSRLFEL
jgi:hypothetical protein